LTIASDSEIRSEIKSLNSKSKVLKSRCPPKNQVCSVFPASRRCSPEARQISKSRGVPSPH
jgi:hypothetical protein